MNVKMIIPSLAALLLQACIIGGGTGGEGIQAGETLTGVIVDAGGEPVAGAMVTVYPESTFALPRKAAVPIVDSTITDAAGRFEFETLVSGRYSLVSSITRNDSTLALFVDGIDLKGAISLGTDTLKPAGTLNVTVVDSANTPVADVTCFISWSPWSATSDQAGKCTIEGVASGSYVLVVGVKDEPPALVSVMVNAGETTETTVVTAAAPSPEPVFARVTTPLSAADALNAVAWTGTQYVAVGDVGLIMTSPDGTQWTPRTTGRQVGLHGIASTGTGLVAVGENGEGSAEILTSPDGISWTFVSSAIGTNLYSVAASASIVVAVGEGGTIRTSANGTGTWTSRTSGTTHDLRDIIWTGTQFIAVGYSFTNFASVALTSPDGVTWTQRSTGPSGSGWFSVAWSGNRTVVVGDGGGWYSDDLVTWTPWATATGALSVTWVDGQFVAVGRAPVNKAAVWTSPEGSVWTNRYLDALDGMSSLRAVTGGANSMVVGVGNIIVTAP